MPVRVSGQNTLPRVSFVILMDDRGIAPAALRSYSTQRCRLHVAKIVVCDPRRNALLKEGNKSDRIDARKLAELLRANLLRSVYHGERGLRAVKEASAAKAPGREQETLL